MKKEPSSLLKKAFAIKSNKLSNFRNRDRVGDQDQDDLYRFRVRSTSQIDVRLSNLKQNANLELYAPKKKLRTVKKQIGGSDFSQLKRRDVRRNLKRLARSKRSGKKSEQFSLVVEPGTYYVRVTSKSKKETHYRLVLTATAPVLPPPIIQPPKPSDNPSTPAQTNNRVERSWLVQFGNNEDDQVSDLAIDNNGGLYAVGATNGSLESDLSGLDAFIRKYNVAGAEQWKQEVDRNLGDVFYRVTVNPDNTISATGISRWADSAEQAATGTLPEGLAQKYSPSGSPLSQSVLDSIVGTEQVTSSVPGVSGQLYAIVQRIEQDTDGLLQRLLETGSDPNANVGEFTTSIPIIQQYTETGSLTRSEAILPGVPAAILSAIADTQDNLYVTGKYNAKSLLTLGQVTDIANGNPLDLDELDDALDGDVFVAKYNPQGQQLWLDVLSSNGSDTSSKIALDTGGNVYVVGQTAGTLPGGQANQGQTDAFVTKYSANGDRQWVQQFGTSARDRATDVAVAGDGTVYVSGWTDGSLFGNALGGRDGWFATFESDGTLRNSQQIGTTSDDRAESITVDGNGRIYVGGSTAGNLGGSNQGGLDAWIAQYTEK